MPTLLNVFVFLFLPGYRKGSRRVFASSSGLASNGKHESIQSYCWWKIISPTENIHLESDVADWDSQNGYMGVQLYMGGKYFIFFPYLSRLSPLAGPSARQQSSPPPRRRCLPVSVRDGLIWILKTDVFISSGKTGPFWRMNNIYF